MSVTSVPGAVLHLQNKKDNQQIVIAFKVNHKETNETVLNTLFQYTYASTYGTYLFLKAWLKKKNFTHTQPYTHLQKVWKGARGMYGKRGDTSDKKE